MVKINKTLLPIKAHFFFFMAAMGPILPQLSVYGKELGISSVVMGSVTGVLPIMFLLAKPAFGIIVDIYRDHRKAIFMTIITIMSVSFALLYFIPARFIATYQLEKSCERLDTCNVTDYLEESKCNGTRRIICGVTCDNVKQNISIRGLLVQNDSQQQPTSKDIRICSITNNISFPCDSTCDVECLEDVETNNACLYKSFTFWSFIVLMAVGTIAFNVVNSISDAICCDVIGDQHDYGKQRVWGTVGFGVTALIAGFVVDYWSDGEITYTPAFIVMLIFTAIDLFACIKLQLPILEAPKNIFEDLKKLFNHAHTITFLTFAVFAGIMDSFVVYFLFWYIEDLAIMTHTTNVKLLEGLIVAAETLGAEVIFFSISGKILEMFGHAYAFSMCFISYALRFALISIIPTPWWILPIEFVMQGPTYALTYTTIVAYANAISPPGMSATMQGIAAGMDDGFGYALGSILGGFLYKYIGGRAALQTFSGIGIACGVTHILLYKTILQRHDPPTKHEIIKYQTPEDAATFNDSNESEQ